MKKSHDVIVLGYHHIDMKSRGVRCENTEYAQLLVEIGIDISQWDEREESRLTFNFGPSLLLTLYENLDAKLGC